MEAGKTVEPCSLEAVSSLGSGHLVCGCQPVATIVAGHWVLFRCGCWVFAAWLWIPAAFGESRRGRAHLTCKPVTLDPGLCSENYPVAGMPMASDNMPLSRTLCLHPLPCDCACSRCCCSPLYRCHIYNHGQDFWPLKIVAILGIVAGRLEAVEVSHTRCQIVLWLLSGSCSLLVVTATCLPALTPHLTSVACIIFGKLPSPGPTAPTPGQLAVSAIGGRMQPRDIRPLVSQERCHQSLPFACMPASCPQQLLTMPQERPGIHMGWGGRQAWLAGCCLSAILAEEERTKKKSQSARRLSLNKRESHGHLKWLPLSMEKGSDLIPFTLRKPLLPSCLISQRLFSAYRSRILAGKSEEEAAGGKVRETGGASPFPATRHCLRSLLFPFVGAEPNVFSLTWQSWLRKRCHRVSVQEPCGKGYKRLCPSPPSVHLQATVCVARELGEREKEREKERPRERGGEREKEG
ncbi:hypothetical protein E2320_009918 [Naja naja]|nr:hypothetical protein E2320_009918 [Naja naja]